MRRDSRAPPRLQGSAKASSPKLYSGTHCLDVNNNVAEVRVKIAAGSTRSNVIRVGFRREMSIENEESPTMLVHMRLAFGVGYKILCGKL